MRGLVLLFVCALVVTSAVALIDKETKQEFKDFLHKFGKNYTNPVEFAKREAIFAKNKVKRIAHNLKFKEGVHGWETAVNQFADQTIEEVIGHLGYRESPNVNDSIPASVAFPENGKRAAELDWRARGKVGPVKNQASCGSCWAFATTSVVESCIAIAKNIPPPNLSEQQLQDCMFDKVCSPGGGGGAAGIDWVKDHGVSYGQDYPYLVANGNCHDTNSHAHVTSRVHGGTEDDLQNMLNNGPVLIGLNADLLLSYSRGVINDAGHSRSRNHAVTVVGVTGNCDGVSAECWIIKNQWGSGWGENGFFRVAKGQRVIGLGDDSDMPAGCSGDKDGGGSQQGKYGPIEFSDRPGGDLGGMPFDANDAQDCQTHCFQNNACSSWAFDTCGHSCWLKDSNPGQTGAGCRASGIITASRGAPQGNCPAFLKSCGDACYKESEYCCPNGKLTQKQFC